MDFYNEFTFTFQSKEESERAIDIIKSAIKNSSRYDFEDTYTHNFRDEMVDNIHLINHEMEFYSKINVYDVVLDNGYYLTASDALEFIVDLLKSIGNTVGDYKFSASNNDTYEDSYVEAQKENGVLKLSTVLYPEGYYDEIDCDECGYEIVERDEWDGTPIIECPVCGSKINVEELFEIDPERNHLTFNFSEL